jgi:Protein of unknown function (DUF4058)
MRVRVAAMPIGFAIIAARTSPQAHPMPSPLPGMNPFLESPDLWSEFHSRMIVAIADALDTTLSQDYRVAVEKRVYLSQGEETILIGIPDVSVTATLAIARTTTAIAAEPMVVEIPLAEEVQERYLEIREIATGRVVTVIELLPPKNKRPGDGRDAYSQKRQRIMLSQIHLVEIDLLRSGDPLPMVGAVTSNYRIMVSRSDGRPKAQLYVFNLPQPIPAIEIPLAAGTSVTLELQPLLHQVYDRARLTLSIDYQQPPVPKLPADDWAWLQTTIATALKR